ncbi:hypothetical protein EO087_09815 [Dyella sp. M7H15-1]|uniref:hypothetical protein n=1 Tax=Dyella sp. M7H15-1 TaxID=2501295 RepID=UPI001004E7FD|nr:hypothetical protein [Dyella sp. M7H15-1]QAU24249.1 hypothetical protein EO087_09815 [Dyella sp. M7H15-1]
MNPAISTGLTGTYQVAQALASKEPAPSTNSEPQGLKALSDPKIFALDAHDIDRRNSVMETCRSLTNHSDAPHRICEINIVKAHDNLSLEFSDDPSTKPIATLTDIQADFKNDAHAKAQIVDLAENVLQQSGQLQYLNDNIDSFTKEGFHPVITIDYYGDRKTDVNTIGFHRDSTDSTLFVDLIYNTNHPIDGPEYLKSGTLDQDYFKEFVQPNMPTTALEHINAESIEHDGANQKIKLCRIPADGVVGFTDALVFHSTPQEASRAVLKEDLFGHLNNDSGNNSDINEYAFKHAYRLENPGSIKGEELENLEEYVENISPWNKRNFDEISETFRPIAKLILNSRDGDKIYKIDVQEAMIEHGFGVEAAQDYADTLYHRTLRQNPLDEVALINCGNTCHSRLTSTSFPLPGKMEREKSLERTGAQGRNQAPLNNGAQPREFLRLWVQFKKSDPT